MIILLGFPKCGTSSFQKLFTMLGFKSYQWKKNGKFIGMIIKENKDQQKKLLSGFDETDCITQMDVCVSEKKAYWPQITDYEQIYYENTDALFILNKRPPLKLLSSFKNWGNLLKRVHDYSPAIFKNYSDEGFLELINRHYNNVESFFLERPTSKFISYDIETDDVSKLSTYIDLRDITVFPKVNVSKKK